MKISLIHPTSASVYTKFRRSAIKRLPIGLAYIAGFLEKQGFEVLAVDAEALDYDLETTVAEALLEAPRLVGVTATTPIVHNAIRMLHMVKEQSPETITMLGGPHASALPEETLLDNPNALDFVVIGEGEHTAVDIARAVEGGQPFANPIAGAMFLDADGKLVKGPSRQRERNLDSLAFPARHLFPMHRYIDATKHGNDLYTLVVSSRGCPGKCTFCGSKTTWGRLVRFRSPENVAEELAECYHRYNINNFVFSDDTFTLQTRHTIETCKKIIELGYPLNIYCSSRPNTISEERLAWLKKAGVYCVTYGIESGNDEILRLMKKQTTVKMVREAVAMTKNAGISVHGSFIIGNLGDTAETIEETIEFALSLDLDQVQFSILVPLPGTELFDVALQRKAFRAEPKKYESFFWYYSVPANLTDLPDERLIELQESAYKRWKASKTKNSSTLSKQLHERWKDFESTS